jgi:hypothetical protein
MQASQTPNRRAQIPACNQVFLGPLAAILSIRQNYASIFLKFFWQQHCYGNVSMENAIRPGAAGRKIMWFIGPQEAGWRSRSFTAFLGVGASVSR